MATQFKRDLVQSFAKVCSGKGKRQSYEGYGAANCYCETYMETGVGVGFIKVVNNSSKHVKLTFTFRLDKMKLIPPHTSPHVFSLAPNREEAIGFFMKAAGYSYGASQSMQFS